MSDNTQQCIIMCTLMLSLVAVIVACVAIDAYRDCRYIEAGYTRVTLPGADFPQWVKEPVK